MPAIHVVVFRRKSPLAGRHSKAAVWRALLSANVALSLPVGPEQKAEPLITRRTRTHNEDPIGSIFMPPNDLLRVIARAIVPDDECRAKRHSSRSVGQYARPRQMTPKGVYGAGNEQMQRAHHLSHARRPVEGATSWRDPYVASLSQQCRR